MDGSVLNDDCDLERPQPVWNNPTRSRDCASSSDDNSDTWQENQDRDQKDTTLLTADDTSVHSHNGHVVPTS